MALSRASMKLVTPKKCAPSFHQAMPLSELDLPSWPFRAEVMCETRSSHQVVVHFQWHTSHEGILDNGVSMHASCVLFYKLSEQTHSLGRLLAAIRSLCVDLQPDIPLTRPDIPRSAWINDPSGTSGNPSGGGSAYNGSRRTLGSPCVKAFSPWAKFLRTGSRQGSAS